MPKNITAAELPALKNALRDGDAEAWSRFEGRYLALPSWFDTSLDPMGQAYRDQQFKLWEMLGDTSGEYEASRDEQFDDYDASKVITSPGFYAPRTPGSVARAGDHLIAMGHLLRIAGLVAGDWVLEYGAGYGQIALALARLGVNVDTVDINPAYNRAITDQAGHFEVPLTSFQGVFGTNPRGNKHYYDIALFYEAFHHSADFLTLPGVLRGLLKPGGRILMAGEPVANHSPSVPYPWGVRLDAEAVAVSGVRRWLELGFTEDFLVRVFARNGFVWRKHECHLSHFGIIHEFAPRPARIDMEAHRLPPSEDETWYLPEPGGRWTRGRSVMSIDDFGPAERIVVVACSHNPKPIVARFAGSESFVETAFLPGEIHATEVKLRGNNGLLEVTAPTFSPDGGRTDARQLGLFVMSVTYV